jgi:shikimate dehydrogenase
MPADSGPHGVLIDLRLLLAERLPLHSEMSADKISRNLLILICRRQGRPPCPCSSMKPDIILSLPARPVPYAVVGSPINHSLSPVMQQSAFDYAGLEARYFRIEADEESLEHAVNRMRQVPFGGWNCTIPNKVKMYGLCDRRAESAEQFRAVNTVVNEGGVLVGHNTDGVGWSRALREAFGRGPNELRILLLGTGGAGRALATQAILERCPELIVANRDARRAQELLIHLNTQFSTGPLARTPRNLRAVPWSESGLEAALREVDLVVNATSAGLDPKAPALLPARILPPNLLVFDTVYGAGCVKLRREVEAAGARWSDGLGMLLHQGAEAFTLWTGRDAPLEIMRKALGSSVPDQPPA